MNLQPSQDLFAVRLYEWSQRDFLRELEGGCPLLACMGLNNRRIAAFILWNETLDPGARRELMIALTKRSHENAARLKGETVTERDRHWDQTLYEHTWGGLQEEHVPPLLTALRDSPGFEPLEADECLNTLAASLSPTMGRISRRKSKVICTKQIGDWKVITEFTLIRRDEELSFEYQFIRKDGGRAQNPHPAQGPFPRTLLFFYGLGFTTVQVPSKIDGERMAKVMPKLAEHFVGQAASLFDGLGINDRQEAANSDHKRWQDRE